MDKHIFIGIGHNVCFYKIGYKTNSNGTKVDPHIDFASIHVIC